MISFFCRVPLVLPKIEKRPTIGLCLSVGSESAFITSSTIMQNVATEIVVFNEFVLIYM